MVARNTSGQFVKGESGNPKGRPPKERELRFYEITLETVTFEEWRVVIKKALEQAKKGDSVARKFLADYLMGQPVQRTELTGAGGGAIEIDDESILRKLLPELAAGRAAGADRAAE